jgi:hypothetical protein
MGNLLLYRADSNCKDLIAGDGGCFYEAKKITDPNEEDLSLFVVSSSSEANSES